MNIYQFGRILLVNSLLVVTLNGLLYWQPVKTLLDQRQTAVVLGLFFYAVQFMTIYFLLEKQKWWLTQPLQVKRVLQALGAMVVVQALTICLITSLTINTQAVSLSDQFTSFWPVFVLNSLPGALLEEWLFRYLPLRFGQQAKKRHLSILYCLGALALFTLLHVPAYLLQYNLSLTELGRVFTMGLFFLTIYFLTQNLIFTAFFHGLTNNPLYIIKSPYYWLYFYASVLVVSIFWAILNWRSQRNLIVV